MISCSKNSFALTDEGLEIAFTVSGERDMPFMLGYHPAFKLHSKTPENRLREKGRFPWMK